MTHPQLEIPTIDDPVPPTFEQDSIREIVVPIVPENPDQGTQKFTVDLRPWLVVQDLFSEVQLRYVTSWLNSLGVWTMKSEAATNVIRGRRIKYHLSTNGKSSYYCEKHCLPSDHDYMAWYIQTRWLKNAVRILERVADNLRSYNATQRVMLTPGNQPS